MKAIYRIINNINGKSYIGQSIDPIRRFREHCGRINCNSLINKAIKKYGKDNFSLEVIGWFEDYNEKEKYYIEYYKTLVPYGYNILKGGEEPPYLSKENHPLSKISEEEASNIQNDLLNLKISRRQIIKKYKITNDILRHINDGTSWYNNNLTYPLRPQEKELNKIRADEVIKLLQTTNLSQKEIGQKVGWNRSAITMINIGKNYHKDNIDYPIRK